MTQIVSLPDHTQQLNEKWKALYKVAELPNENVLAKMLDKTKGKVYMKGKHKGFIGSLLCSHKFIWDITAPTAWCDGETIAFNPWFFTACTWEGRMTVLVHECWHTGADHFGRIGNRHPGDWNIAGDYWINTTMQQNDFSFAQSDLAGVQAYLNSDYVDLSTEQIYDIVHKENEQKRNQQCNQNSNQGNKPCDQNSGGSGNNAPQDKYVQAAGDIDDLPACAGDMREPPKSGKPGSQSDAAERRMRKIISAVQSSQMAKDAGTIPGEITAHIEKWLHPVLDWRILLQRWFTEKNNEDYSYKRPNRRYEDEYLPSLYSEDGLDHLAFYIDCSVSVTDAELLRILSEARSIHKDITPSQMSVVTFDTEIQQSWIIQADDPFEKLNVTRGGGTSLDCVRRHIKATAPTAAIILSDLHVEPMHDDPGVPVLWISVANPKAYVKFGELIHITKQQVAGLEDT